jgi:WD40 repeat protein
MKYNSSFLIFIYFYIATQSSCAMEEPLDITKKAIPLDRIKSVANYRKIYCAHYGNKNTIIMMDKQNCYGIGTNKEKKTIKVISDIGFNLDEQCNIIYNQLIVHPNHQKIIIANDHKIEMRDINTGKQEWCKKEENYTIRSICFGSEDNTIFLLLKKNNTNYLLRKYDYKKHTYIGKKLGYSNHIHFGVYPKKSILCVITKNKRSLIYNSLQLYNSSNLSLQTEIKKIVFNDTPFQISDDGFLALIGLYPNKFYIFDLNKNILEFKIDNNLYTVKSEEFHNVVFYPTTSIILAISKTLLLNKAIARYYDTKTKDCIYEALINCGDISNTISFSPDGSNVAITSYNKFIVTRPYGARYIIYQNPFHGCAIYKVPLKIAYRHAKNDFLYRLFLIKQYTTNSPHKLQLPMDITKIITKIIFEPFE